MNTEQHNNIMCVYVGISASYRKLQTADAYFKEAHFHFLKSLINK